MHHLPQQTHSFVRAMYHQHRSGSDPQLITEHVRATMDGIRGIPRDFEEGIKIHSRRPKGFDVTGSATQSTSHNLEIEFAVVFFVQSCTR